MTTLTGTPDGQTETGAAYTQAAALLNDEFDTSGTPTSFCPDCEHAPCVTGTRGWCAHRPRFVVRRGFRQDLLKLAGEVAGPDNLLDLALQAAIFGLGDVSWMAGHVADYAYDDMVRVFNRLREAKEAQS